MPIRPNEYEWVWGFGTILKNLPYIACRLCILTPNSTLLRNVVTTQVNRFSSLGHPSPQVTANSGVAPMLRTGPLPKPPVSR